jgi:hypothetical protein
MFDWRLLIYNLFSVSTILDLCQLGFINVQTIALMAAKYKRRHPFSDAAFAIYSLMKL